MHRLALTDEEVGAIRSLIKEVASEHDSVEDVNFLNSVHIYAHRLPRWLREFLNAFRLMEPSAVCVVSG